MFSWLNFWKTPKPAPTPQPELPDEPAVSARAPSTEAIRTPPPGIQPGAPRYSFAAFDSAPPRRTAQRRADDLPQEDGSAEPIVGIDLGTTHAAIAVVQDRRIVLIANQEGDLLTPCVVARSDGQWLVGEAARRQALGNPLGTARSFKRWLGKPTTLPVGDQQCPPQQLAAFVLRKLREAAEARLGRPVRRAVLTVPASCGAATRQATIEAAEIAGFSASWSLPGCAHGPPRLLPMRVIHKPTAAALGFGLTTAWTHDRKVAVLHLGGGQLDVALLHIADGVFLLRALGGSPCGGDELDGHLAYALLKRCPDLPGNPRQDAVAWSRLLQAVEQARRDLTSVNQSELCLPYFLGNYTLQQRLHRGDLEQIAQPLVENWRKTITETLQSAGWKQQEVGEVALLGGLARMPLFRSVIDDLFGSAVRCRTHPPEIVAAGAAIQGHQLQLGPRSDVLLVNVIPRAIWITSENSFSQAILGRNRSIPTQQQLVIDLPLRQGAVRAQIYESGPGTNESTLLGQIGLESIEPDNPGTARVELTCSYDASSRIEVTMRQPSSGRSVTVGTAASTGMSLAEVARLAREAEHQRLFQQWGAARG